LKHLSDNICDRKYAVLRQDDNGNQFVVEAGLSRDEAERLAHDLEARGHKQLYWVEIEEAASA
jgi:hypothetical protein